MKRQEYLEWCKKRAYEYIESGDYNGALASMYSDLRKDPETETHPAIQLGLMLQMAGSLSTKEEVKKFIEGFN